MVSIELAGGLLGRLADRARNDTTRGGPRIHDVRLLATGHSIEEVLAAYP